jgi:hypothetical protein
MGKGRYLNYFNDYVSHVSNIFQNQSSVTISYETSDTKYDTFETTIIIDENKREDDIHQN